VKVLEEVLCDYKVFPWEDWDAHINQFNTTELGKGKVALALCTALHCNPLGKGNW
jgi:hypothetical protein